MSSILTNNGAMVALQSLKSINTNLNRTQVEISTGKAVGSAKENAAVWAISKVMESDVQGFKGIAESLSLGESTVAVARKAAETVTGLLNDVKAKIVAAQEDNVDRNKLQTDIAALTKTIEAVVGAAQFNGLNLVNGAVTTQNASGNTGVNVLGSLDRSSTGAVVAGQIAVDAQNLSLSAGVVLDPTAAKLSSTTPASGIITKSGGTLDAITLDTVAFLGGGAALSRTDKTVANTDVSGMVEGDQLNLRIGSVEGRYTIKQGDTKEAVVSGIKNALIADGLDKAAFTLDIGTAGQLKITNNTNQEFEYRLTATRGNGDLAALSNVNVSTQSGAQTALNSIEKMIQASINAAAAFGSVEKRISIQNDFVGQLSDAMKSGIGALVDANMEEASARLQALQTQQQLGIQALSIANQAPQSILALFR